MPSYFAATRSVCAIDGLDTSDGDFAWFLYFAPKLLWVSLSAVALYGRDIYITLIACAVWFLWTPVVIIQELTKQQHPDPSCNNLGLAMPSWETAMVYCALVIMLAHKLIYFRRISLLDIPRGLWLGAAVPVALGVTNNYTTVQIIIGAVVGAVFGGLVVLEIWFFWMERIVVLTNSNGPEGAPHNRLFGWWSFRDDIPGFYKPFKLKDDPSLAHRAAAAYFAGELAYGGPSATHQKKKVLGRLSTTPVERTSYA